MQLLASIAIVVIVAAFMMLTFLAAWALTFVLGITGFGPLYVAWAIVSIAALIAARRIAHAYEYRGINLN